MEKCRYDSLSEKIDRSAFTEMESIISIYGKCLHFCLLCSNLNIFYSCSFNCATDRSIKMLKLEQIISFHSSFVVCEYYGRQSKS
jgi:hypothetical protein